MKIIGIFVSSGNTNNHYNRARIVGAREVIQKGNRSSVQALLKQGAIS